LITVDNTNKNTALSLERILFLKLNHKLVRTLRRLEEIQPTACVRQLRTILFQTK
jgi:hypothetical protein